MFRCLSVSGLMTRSGCHREVAPLLSGEPFSVYGTLIKASASMKSIQPKPEVSPPGSGDGPGNSPPPPPAAEAEVSPLPGRS
jgi:hypothetical protein